MTRALLVLFALLAAVPEASRAAGAMEDYMELYRWGEYDSLMRLLEPKLAALPAEGAVAASPAEKAEAARAHLALGVAYWASGRTLEADRTFMRALRLDPSQRLDPLYSTPEMALRLETLAQAERRAAARPEGGAGRTAGGAQSGPERKPKRGWLVWTGAAVATGLVAGVGAYYMAQDHRSSGRDTLHVVIPAD